MYSDEYERRIERGRARVQSIAGRVGWFLGLVLHLLVGGAAVAFAVNEPVKCMAVCAVLVTYRIVVRKRRF
jgi:hypothetical protein